MISNAAFFNSDNWKYLGEGKVHIIFSHEVRGIQHITSECTLIHDIEVVSSTRSIHDDSVDRGYQGDYLSSIRRSSNSSDEYSQIDCVPDSLDSQEDFASLHCSCVRCSTMACEKLPSLRNGRNRVLRVTKKCHGKEDILQDELFLRNVIKPWFGGAICSDRRLVEIPAGFLGSEHSYCSLQMRSQL